MNYLAENLRRLRKAAALTQQQLADLAKLPRATLASMERDGANPGLDSVIAVAVALHVGLDELVSPPPEHRFFKVTEGHVKESRADGGRFIARLLSPIASRGVQVQHVVLLPGCDTPGRSHPIGSQEFFFTYEGTAELQLADEQVSVEPGSLVQFPGHLPHVYRNNNRATEVLGYSVITLS